MIEYKRIMLTGEGRQTKGFDGVLIAAEPDDVASPADKLFPDTKRRTKRRAKRKKPEQVSMDSAEAEASASPELVTTLQAWRREEARKKDLPAYCIMQNHTLLIIAATRPQSEPELLAIKGMGPARVKQHGEAILAMMRDA